MPHSKEHRASKGLVGVNLFAPYTEEQVQALRMGTPAYEMLHPHNKIMSSGTPDKHYKSLVQPTMSKVNKSMAKNLGQSSMFIGSKFNGLA
jgi:hypothetical protein